MNGELTSSQAEELLSTATEGEYLFKGCLAYAVIGYIHISSIVF